MSQSNLGLGITQAIHELELVVEHSLSLLSSLEEQLAPLCSAADSVERDEQGHRCETRITYKEFESAAGVALIDRRNAIAMLNDRIAILSLRLHGN